MLEETITLPEKEIRWTSRKLTSHALVVFCLSAIFGLGSVTYAKVIRIEITKRADWLGGRSFGSVGTYEMISGRVYYAVNPKDAANKGITDLMLAPRNQQGLVEFSGDFLVLRPKDPAKARGTVLFEVANRGVEQVARTFFRLLPGQRLSLLDPSAVSGLEDALVFEQGFTFAWAGWQFDVPASVGLRLQVPVADVSGDVRAIYIGEVDKVVSTFQVNPRGGYCAADPNQSDAVLTARTRIDGPPTVIPRDQWMFAREESGKVVSDPCSVRLARPFEPKQLYEVVYRAKGSPIAGLGLAAVRDFLSYLKHGEAGAILREHPETLSTVLGYGYSQSARFLRSFIYEGFNADERGRKVFDGMFIASGGPGRGDFNSRFAIPGVAGNSVLSVLYPVDVFPFTDLPETDPLTRTRDGLLVKAERQRVLPKIFHTHSSTEYWARVGSLAHTTVDGLHDLPLHPNTRLYYVVGTPHQSYPFPLSNKKSARGETLAYFANPAPQAFVSRSLLLALDDWVRRNVAPPPSAYPTLRNGELVSFDAVSFPKLSGIEFPTYMPRNWRMNFGPDFARTGVKAFARPTLGAPYKLLVPQVGRDGNERSGILLPHVAVPLATYTGWNYTVPRPDNLDYLAGLVGSFIPFPRTAEERVARNDPRLSIQERYGSRENYLKQISAAAEALVKQRYVRKEDMAEIVRQADQLWEYVVVPEKVAPQTAAKQPLKGSQPASGLNTSPESQFCRAQEKARKSFLRLNPQPASSALMRSPSWPLRWLRPSP